jgi:hypothetical protein
MVSTTPASFGTYPTWPALVRFRALIITLAHPSPSSSFRFPQLPTHIGSIMSSDGRSRRRELVEEAYNLQVKAGLMASRIPFWISFLLVLFALCSLSFIHILYHIISYHILPIKLTHDEQSAAQYGALGLGSAIFAHRTWPTFQSVSSCPAQPTALRDPFRIRIE